MSLVYDALRQQGDAALPDRPPARASWSWSRLEPRLRTALLFGAGALVAAPLAFLAGGGAGGTAAPAPVTASPTAAWTVPVTVDAGAPDSDADTPFPADFAGADPAPAPSTLAAAQPVPAPAAPPVAVVPSAPAASFVEAAPGASAAANMPTATPLPAPSPTPINIQVTQRTAGAAPSGGDGKAAVEQAIRAIQAALAVDDGATARDALARLESLLHADSLTLLRMRAWVAHETHDMGSAEQLYRQIAERVPDDINAGINIARLDASHGRIDDARSRLLRLSGRHSRSPQVARALAELDAMPR